MTKKRDAGYEHVKKINSSSFSYTNRPVKKHTACPRGNVSSAVVGFFSLLKCLLS